MHDPTDDPELLRAAFRDLHGARLHGFALVLLLGDRETAASVTRATILHFADDAPRLRHPERAAAVLRADVVRTARRLRGRRGFGEAERMTLAHLGIDGPTANALAALDLVHRAALLAAELERFGDEDVALILGTGPGRARRRAADARRRYLDAHAGDDGERRAGSITQRVGAVASATMGR